MIFNKSKNQLVTKKNVYNLTEQVKVADVKQYLIDEYQRAFERETTIGELEKEIKGLLEIKLKYDALLVISDRNRERLLNCEEKIKEYKEIIKQQNSDNKVLKNENNNILLNYKKHLTELTRENEKLKKEVNKTIKIPKRGKKS